MIFDIQIENWPIKKREPVLFKLFDESSISPSKADYYAFSLLFGAYYFRCDIFYNKAEEILLNELNEQILKDGAHFELSPMYHSIILGRLLDSIYLITNHDYKSKNILLDILIDKSQLMLSWLDTIKYQNNNIPNVINIIYRIQNIFFFLVFICLVWCFCKYVLLIPCIK